MRIDEVKNGNLILDVRGCNYLEFDSMTANGSLTDGSGTYYTGANIRVYDYDSATQGDYLYALDGGIVRTHANGNNGLPKSLSNKTIDVRGIDYVKVNASNIIANKACGTTCVTGLKGY